MTPPPNLESDSFLETISVAVAASIEPAVCTGSKIPIVRGAGGTETDCSALIGLEKPMHPKSNEATSRLRRKMSSLLK